MATEPSGPDLADFIIAESSSGQCCSRVLARIHLLVSLRGVQLPLPYGKLTFQSPDVESPRPWWEKPSLAVGEEVSQLGPCCSVLYKLGILLSTSSKLLAYPFSSVCWGEMLSCQRRRQVCWLPKSMAVRLLPSEQMKAPPAGPPQSLLSSGGPALSTRAPRSPLPWTMSFFLLLLVTNTQFPGASVPGEVCQT